METIKEFSSEQRTANPGEPICIICGKYAEYICSITEVDICSKECKMLHLSSIQLQPPPQSADSYSSFLSPEIAKKVDFPYTKSMLDLLPAVLYRKDILIISPNHVNCDLAISVPLIQRIVKTQKTLLVICEGKEVRKLKTLFEKYTKGIKNFKIAALENLLPLPCEVNRLQKNPKVVISGIKRFIRAYLVFPIKIQYLWIYNLSGILHKHSPSKLHQIYKLLEKQDDFSALWIRRHIQIVYVSDTDEGIINQIAVLRLCEDYLVYKFTSEELEAKQEIPCLKFFKCKNVVKSLLYILRGNPAFQYKNICIFADFYKAKLEKVLNSKKIKQELTGSILISSEKVENFQFDVYINAECPKLQNFKSQLNNFPIESQIITLLPQSSTYEVLELQSYLESYPHVNFPSYNF